nr:Stk1 family PASTA domain-containing Ser/Thr kinase [Corynebacterium mendelii]
MAGRYKLGFIIGSGGMADVYATTDTMLGRDVAVKMMRSNLASDEVFRERFRREAQNAAKLNHDAIVQIYDTGETDINGVQVPYIVMERVQGRTLRDIVHEDGPYTPVDAAKILLPVCSALQHSHEQGIVHRDVKPANIMITNTGDVKIMDFGIARVTGDAAASMTQTQAVIGTAQYLSPEQARGKSADARSDVYALGCVLYEAVTGNPPFEADSPFAVAYKHVQENPVQPSTLIPDLSPTAAVNIDSVVLTAMAKNPADRYQSAAELGKDLQLVSRNAVSFAAKAHLAPAAGNRHGVANPITAETAAVTVVQRSVPDHHSHHAPDGGHPDGPPGPGAPAPAGRHAAEPVPAESGRTGGVLTAVIGVLAVTVIIVGAFFTWDYLTGGRETTATIPQLAGHSQQDATTDLENLGLVVTATTEASPDIAEGAVIATNPGAGSQLKTGSTVVISVSSGQTLTTVPSVKNRTTEVAATILERAGLLLDTEVREETSDTVAAGRVIDQDPSPTEQVAKGSKVTITVSTGAGTQRVPVITGQKWQQAESNLIAAGFTPVVQNIDSELPEGTVVDCEHEGTDQPTGSSIVVKVSNGLLVSMPDLTGMNPDQAFQALRAAGWIAPQTSLLSQPVPTGSLVESGLIQSQTPLPGDMLKNDGLVSIRVGSFDPLAAFGN